MTAIIILTLVGLLVWWASKADLHRQRRAAQARKPKPTSVVQHTLSPVVNIATGTGKLIERNHVSGIPNGSPVIIDADLAARGIVVIGPSGSGKTRAILQPFAGHWLDCECAGMFAFAEKPNWARILCDIAVYAGRRPEQVHVVGPMAAPWPLLRGLSPDSVANFIRTAMEIGGGKGDRFFVSSAENLVRRVANVLYATSQLGPITIERRADNGEILESFVLDYDLFSVSKLARMDYQTLDLLIVPEIRASSMILESQGNTDAKRRIEVNLPELLSSAKLGEGEKTKGQREGITGTIDAVLAPFFTEQSFEDAFSGSGTFDLSVLDRGDVVILDVDKDLFPGAATLAFLLAFEQMKLYMRARVRRQQEGEQLNSVLFVADEYANVADGKSHPEMWRVAREGGVCPLIAYQVHTDLQGAIGKDVADGMMQNFATRIVFGTSDPATIALVQAGSAEVLRDSESESSGYNTGVNHGQGGGNSGWNSGSSTSTGVVERKVVDEQLMDSLINRIRRSVPVEQQTAEVIVRTSQGDRRVLDVCTVKAWDPPRT